MTPVLLLIPMLLAAFWLWMFNHMLRNGTIPDSSSIKMAWPPRTKMQWVVSFILLNVFTAGYYYFTEYKNG